MGLETWKGSMALNTFNLTWIGPGFNCHAGLCFLAPRKCAQQALLLRTTRSCQKLRRLNLLLNVPIPHTGWLRRTFICGCLPVVWSPYPRPVSGSFLSRYVELDTESGLVELSSSSSPKKFFYVIFVSSVC